MTTTAKRTANHAAWKFVDKREPFQGSSCYGETYSRGNAPHMGRSWLSNFETEHYNKMRDRVTYIVWSFYTPIGYFVEGQGWYLVGQTFSAHTGRHRSGAFRNIRGHHVTMDGKRGDWTVTCHKVGCWEPRHFTEKREAERVLHTH